MGALRCAINFIFCVEFVSSHFCIFFLLLNKKNYNKIDFNSRHNGRVDEMASEKRFHPIEFIWNCHKAHHFGTIALEGSDASQRTDANARSETRIGTPLDSMHNVRSAK